MTTALRSLAFCLSLAATPLACQAEWFTLSDKADRPDERVQVDPTSITTNGQTRTVQLRVSRNSALRAANGALFRAYEGTASVDCIARIASYDRLAYYARGDFTGTPVYQRSFGPQELRPAALDSLRPELAERVMRAACRVRPSESNATG